MRASIIVDNYNEVQGINSVVDQFIKNRDKFKINGITIEKVVDSQRVYEQIPNRDIVITDIKKEVIFSKLKHSFLYHTYFGQVATIIIRMIIPGKKAYNRFKKSEKKECICLSHSLFASYYAILNHEKKWLHMTHMFEDPLKNLLMNYPKVKGSPFEKYLRSVVSKVFDCSSGVVTICEHAKHTVEQNFRACNVYTVYNSFSGGIDKNANPGTGLCVKFVSASHLTYVKGIDLFLNIIRRAGKQLEGKCEFHFYGDGEYYKSIKEIITELDLHNIILYGNVSEPYKSYYDKDVYLSTSRLETLPMGIIEAMNAGLPILSTDVGAISEIVKHGENGIIVDVTPESIEKGIWKMINSKNLLNEMGKQSFLSYFNNATPEVWVGKFTEILKNAYYRG